MKFCSAAGQCPSGSINYGIVVSSYKSECCGTNLCNAREIPGENTSIYRSIHTLMNQKRLPWIPYHEQGTTTKLWFSNNLSWISSRCTTWQLQKWPEMFYLWWPKLCIHSGLFRRWKPLHQISRWVSIYWSNVCINYLFSMFGINSCSFFISLSLLIWQLALVMTQWFWKDAPLRVYVGCLNPRCHCPTSTQALRAVREVCATTPSGLAWVSPSS